jgi:hypothetical protein
MLPIHLRLAVLAWVTVAASPASSASDTPIPAADMLSPISITYRRATLTCLRQYRREEPRDRWIRTMVLFLQFLCTRVFASCNSAVVAGGRRSQRFRDRGRAGNGCGV